MIGISFTDYDKFGCPNCGCDRAIRGSFIYAGETTMTCKHCNLTYFILPNERKVSLSGMGTGRKDKDGKDIMEHIRQSIHPRQGIAKWHYENPDIRPETGGEYWKPRGIGYDLSGFVKSKQAGERLLEIVKNVLGKQEPETYLDYRESEPSWIQFKFQKTEFDLEKLYDMTNETGIITKEIIENCKL